MSRNYAKIVFALAGAVAAALLILIGLMVFTVIVPGKKIGIVAENGRVTNVLSSGRHLRPSSKAAIKFVPHAPTFEVMPVLVVNTKDGFPIKLHPVVIWHVDSARLAAGKEDVSSNVETELQLATIAAVKKLIGEMRPEDLLQQHSTLEAALGRLLAEKLPSYFMLDAVLIDRIEYVGATNALVDMMLENRGIGRQRDQREVERLRTLAKEIEANPAILTVLQAEQSKKQRQPASE